MEVSKGAKIRNRYNHVPHLTKGTYVYNNIAYVMSKF